MNNSDKQLWLEAKQEKENSLYKHKRYGHFSYCPYCPFKNKESCSTTKLKRLKETLCAKAYNKYVAD